MRRYPWRSSLLIALLVTVAALCLAFERFDLRFFGFRLERNGLVLGLDLRGGSHLVYQAVKENPSGSDMQGVVRTIERRVNASGLIEAEVRLLGNNRVLVQLPGVGNPSLSLAFQEAVEADTLKPIFAELGRADALVRREGDRTFVVELPTSLKSAQRDEQGNVVVPAEADTIQQALEERVGPLSTFQVSGGIEEVKRRIGQTASLRFAERVCDNAFCTTFTDKETGLGAKQLSKAYPTQDQLGLPVVGLQFDREGTKLFADLTDRLFGTDDQITILLDEDVLVSAVVESPIRNGSGIIRGNFTAERVSEIVLLLESGRLPIDIQVVQERDVDASLGRESLDKSLMAGIVGLSLVALFMVLYYRLPGVLAALALVIYTVLLLAIFKLLPVTLTLSGIAALILSIGMAVDANILIFERLKEELHTGRPLRAALEAGFDRAWTSIRDSNVSTLITCGILWWFGDRLGISVVQGFALVLALGVAVSMFSSIIVSRTLMRIIVQTPLSRALWLFVPVSVPRQAPARPALGSSGSP